MSVRAKFSCSEIKQHTPDTANIRLNPVIGSSPENAEFFKWTPSGTIQLDCLNPQATSQFKVGQEYYVDFTPA